MRLDQAAKFFDRQKFDAYDFTANAWVTNAFQGQLKLADNFVAIWHRPTRKRMLYCAPGQEPTSPVIRVATTGEIFLVGTTQKDSNFNRYYRAVSGLHASSGTVVVSRKTPVVVTGIKGHAVNATVQTTFGDLELRSLNENQTQEFIGDGHFFLFTPSNCPMARHDTVTYKGKTYFVLGVYVDSGYVLARVVDTPDERTDMTYYSWTGTVYNTATLTDVPTFTSYNATGRVQPITVEDPEYDSTVLSKVRVTFTDDFISFTPKVGDEVLSASVRYRVEKITRDAAQSEWNLTARQ